MVLVQKKYVSVFTNFDTLLIDLRLFVNMLEQLEPEQDKIF